MRDYEEFETVIVRLEPVEGTLVACKPMTPAESLDDAVRLYLDDHPDASQNEVEREVTGNSDAVRAAYKRVRLVRPEAGRTPGARCAPPCPLAKEGALGAAPDPTLDPDEHMRQDGGW
ncbi:MAG: hypothetical protein ACXVVK_19325 [Solirubrobacteraceae bacterium]